MKKLIIIPLMLLSACATTQVRPDLGEAKAVQVPALTPELARKAEQLPAIGDPSLGGINQDGIATDMKYNSLAYRYNALVDAWACVRGAVNGRDASKITACFGASK